MTPIEKLIDFIQAELKSGKSLGHEYPHLENVLLKAEKFRNETFKDEPQTPIELLAKKLKLIQRSRNYHDIQHYNQEWDTVWQAALEYEKMYIAMTEQFGAMAERARLASKNKKL
jgi:hypothetical protein